MRYQRTVAANQRVCSWWTTTPAVLTRDGEVYLAIPTEGKHWIYAEFSNAMELQMFADQLQRALDEQLVLEVSA